MWRVLSEIHSSFTTSLSRGRMRITCAAARVDADRRPERIHDVDGFGLSAAPTAARCRPGPVQVSAPTGHRSFDVGRQLGEDRRARDRW